MFEKFWQEIKEKFQTSRNGYSYKSLNGFVGQKIGFKKKKFDSFQFRALAL